MLFCIRYRNRLGAYLDGELNLKEYEAIGAHVAKCVVCQKRLKDIRSLEWSLNDTLRVPPVPDGFATSVMREIRRKRRLKATQARPFLLIGWNFLRWLAELSAPMRIAVCVTMLLACVVGLAMDGGLILDKQSQVNWSTENLYGFEWFEPTPLGSIGSIYITMNAQAYEKGNEQ